MTMENANAKANISVWWDIETCPFPTNNFDHIYYFAKNITLALSNANLHGKLSFFVYANSNLIPSKVLHALNIMGISLCHVPTQGIYFFIHNNNHIILSTIITEFLFQVSTMGSRRICYYGCLRIPPLPIFS
jgi:hypothetical protein